MGYTMNPTFFENSVNKLATMGAVLKITKIVYKNILKFRIKSSPKFSKIFNFSNG
jgi:hypothetical protein